MFPPFLARARAGADRTMASPNSLLGRPKRATWGSTPSVVSQLGFTAASLLRIAGEGGEILTGFFFRLFLLVVALVLAMLLGPIMGWGSTVL